MTYNQRIKYFNRIREYMRDFYVYGFKRRDDFRQKSGRTYDDERRRIESLLGEYMAFRQNEEGKNVFLSIDSRTASHNPLHKAWKIKSFTDGDITLHFLIFDVLHDENEAFSLQELMRSLDDRLSGFDVPKTFDISTVRKKLNEYSKAGIIQAERRGKTMYYSRAPKGEMFSPDCLDFFTEVSPCGVTGSYLMDRLPDHSCDSIFTFKHHYITSATDSEILQQLLDAIQGQRTVTLKLTNRRRRRMQEYQVVPLKIFVSVQSGRQYLMGYTPRYRRIDSYRIDAIVSVESGEAAADFSDLQKKLHNMRGHIWGVSTQSFSGQRMEHVEFTVEYSDDEPHILRRLMREKRCGTVEQLDQNSSRFSADVYDASELIPWMRTFIGRLRDVHFSDPKLEKQFYDDIKTMKQMYQEVSCHDV